MRAKLSADDTALPAELSNTVFRIVQESLTNVMRHAQARSVEVELTRQAAHLQLRIRDDGWVRCRQHALWPGGVGLIGMRERALALGVDCRSRASPAQAPKSVPSLRFRRSPPRPW